MTSGLKSTILASIALAAFLNAVQFAANYNDAAHAAFTVPAGGSAVTSAAPAAARPVTPAPAASAVAAPAAPDPVAAAQARLTAAHLKPDYAANYLAAQARTGTPWQLLAAVHAAETGQSGSTARRSTAGAVGPMQFMPATFAHYAADGDGNGTTDITNLDDALMSAGNYLRAGGADRGRYSAALYNYNHSNTYVSRVLATARRLGL